MDRREFIFKMIAAGTLVATNGDIFGAVEQLLTETKNFDDINFVSYVHCLANIHFDNPGQCFVIDNIREVDEN